MEVYYTREKAYADEKEACYLIGAKSAAERAAVRSVLSQTFKQTDQGWLQTRCEIELQRFKEKAAKASQSASARWGNSKSERNANAYTEAMRTHSEGNANQNQNQNQNQEPKRAEARASRLPQDWILPTSWCEWAEREKGWSTEAARSVADGFRDYWIAKAGKDGRKLDWEATWRNWCRNQRGSEALTFGKTSQAIALLEQMKG